MESVNAPAVNSELEVNQDGTSATTDAPVTATPKKTRVVLADEAALTEYKSRTVNQTVNSVISPELYAHVIKWAYDADPANRGVDEATKRASLKDGSISDAIRAGLAKLTDFSGQLVIKSEASSKVAVAVMDGLRNSSRGLFVMARNSMAMYGTDEAQAKDLAIMALKASQTNIDVELVLSQEILDQLWLESADLMPKVPANA